jgi:hypothetical protein
MPRTESSRRSLPHACNRPNCERTVGAGAACWRLGANARSAYAFLRHPSPSPACAIAWLHKLQFGRSGRPRRSRRHHGAAYSRRPEWPGAWRIQVASSSNPPLRRFTVKVMGRWSVKSGRCPGGREEFVLAGGERVTGVSRGAPATRDDSFASAARRRRAIASATRRSFHQRRQADLDVQREALRGVAGPDDCAHPREQVSTLRLWQAGDPAD